MFLQEGCSKIQQFVLRVGTSTIMFGTAEVNQAHHTDNGVAGDGFVT